eukprot:5352664-Amphidinium_carterae.1
MCKSCHGSAWDGNMLWHIVQVWGLTPCGMFEVGIFDSSWGFQVRGSYPFAYAFHVLMLLSHSNLNYDKGHEREVLCICDALSLSRDQILQCCSAVQSIVLQAFVH